LSSSNCLLVKNLLVLIIFSAFFLFSCERDSSKLGDQYFNSGEYELAIQEYTEYLKLRPKHVKTIYNRGRAYEEMGIYQRALEDFLTVIDIDENIPTKYELIQNYPNPFNPVTIICYALPIASHVELKVFGVLGNEIATLVNESKPAGSYVVEFNGNNLSSGIYYYQLSTENYIQTKKMVLMK